MPPLRVSLAGAVCLLTGCYLVTEPPSTRVRHHDAGGVREGSGEAAGASPDRRDAASRGSDSGLARDAASARERDAGGAHAHDASADVDAAIAPTPSDAGLDAGHEGARFEGDAAPTFPDLVWSDGNRASTHVAAVSTRDLTRVRQLDSTPASIDMGANPIAYSPDARKLLLSRANVPAKTTEYYVSYPCRDTGCIASHAELVLSVAASTPTPSNPPEFKFAADSSGLSLQFPDDTLYYVSTGTERAAPAIPIDADGQSIYGAFFVAGGRGLLADAPKPYLFDLANAVSGTLTPIALLPPELPASASSAIDSVAPSGSHFAYDWWPASSSVLRSFVYDAGELLAGRAWLRELPEGQRVLHLSDQRVIARDVQNIWAERLDGSNPVPLSGIVDLMACGDNVAGAVSRNDSSGLNDVVAFALPGAEDASAAPTLTPLPGETYGAYGRFYRDCQRLLLASSSSCHDNTMIDLVSHETLPIPYSCSAWFSPDASLYRPGTYGLQAVLRVTTSVDPVYAYQPRVLIMPAQPQYAQHAAKIYVGAPVEDPREPGLYEIDLSDPAMQRVRRLRPDILGATVGALSPDDRYVAYLVRHANVADPPEVEPGLFELDLQTLASHKLEPAIAQPLPGLLSLEPIPRTRAVMIVGQYAANEVSAAYACDLDSDRCIAQLPSSIAGSQVLALAANPSGMSVSRVRNSFSYDGTEVAMSVATRDGPALAAFPVRRSESQASPVPTAILVDDAFTGGEVAMQRWVPLGFADGLGLVYTDGVSSAGAAIRSPRDVYLRDFVSGRSQAIDVPEAGWPASTDDNLPGQLTQLLVAGRKGRVIISRQHMPEGNMLHMVEAGAPDTSVAIAAPAVGLSMGRLLGDEFVLYSYFVDPGTPCELHLYELATRFDHLVEAPHPDGSQSVLNCGSGIASPDASMLFISSEDGHVFYFDLHALRGQTATPAPTPVAAPDAPGSVSNTSDDGRRLIWSSQDAIYLLDLDHPERRTQLLIDDARPFDAQLGGDGRFVIERSAYEQPWYLFDSAQLERAPLRLPDELGPGAAEFDASGQYIAFVRQNTIWVMRLDDPEHVQHVSDSYATGVGLFWMP